MKKKGFTLIELLAVIVVLAVIALISTPVILNVIEKAEKGAFEDSAYGVIDAAKLYYADASLDGKVGEETFTFPGDTKLKLSGKKPSGGSAVLYEDGKVSLSISNNKWCAVKEKEKEKVNVLNYSIGDCIVGEERPQTPESCFTVNESGDTITGYTCDSKIVTIPSEINGIEIKKIGDNAFKDKGLTEVTIPEGIISIGSSAFEGNHLTNVVIPKSVTIIGDNAFKNNQLLSVVIGEGVTSIGSGAFEGNQLTTVSIPSSVQTIGDNAFKNNQLTNVEIKEGVTSIGSGAFAGNDLTNIKIPDSVEEIGEGAFEGNNLSGTDQTKAEIKNVNVSANTTSITVIVEAEVGNFGKINRYEYSIDGGNYKEGTNIFTFENLEFGSEHNIGIKVITDSGLVTEKSITATTEKGILSVTVNGYNGYYDGFAHGITVTSEGATIKYGTEEGIYNLDSSPTYTEPGSYLIYYEVTKAGYKTVTGSYYMMIKLSCDDVFSSLPSEESTITLKMGNSKSYSIRSNDVYVSSSDNKCEVSFNEEEEMIDINLQVATDEYTCLIEVMDHYNYCERRFSIKGN